MGPRHSIFLTLCLVLAIFFVPLGQADSTYELSMSGTVDIPSQTVTIDGTEHTYSSVGKVDSDETFSVGVTGPDGALLSVLLYNNDKQIEDSERVNGSGTATFDAGSLSPGTYLVALEGEDGQIQEVLPIVVKGYSVGLQVNDSAAVGESITVNVTVSKVDSSSESLSSITVAVAHDGDDHEVTATEVDDGLFQVSIELDEAGTYGIYAGARGQDTIDGETQLIGISDRSVVTVEDSTGTSSGGQTGGDGAQDTPTNSPTSSATNSPTETDTATPSDSTATPTTSEPAGTDTTSEGVITPRTTTGPPSTETTVTTPLQAMRWLLLLLFVSMAAWRVSSR